MSLFPSVVRRPLHPTPTTIPAAETSRKSAAAKKPPKTPHAPRWCPSVAVVLATIAVASVAFAAPPFTFDDPTVTTQDRFGTSVAIDGNNVLIGASYDDTNGTNVGQAHLFDAISGSLLQTFDDPTVTTEDRFGSSVAIDGNNVLIGAHFDDTNGYIAGQAHLFDATTGNLLKTFNHPTPTPGDLFGFAVAIDGNNVLIGAPYTPRPRYSVGQAFLFHAVTGDLLHTFDVPVLDHFDEEFGASVAIDGNSILIGTPNDDTQKVNVGQAHLFDAISGNRLHTFDDPTLTSPHQFGTSVALDGNNVLIGAPGDRQAHLFTPEPSSLVVITIVGTGLLMRRPRADCPNPTPSSLISHQRHKCQTDS